MRNLVSEIEKGKNLKENITVFGRKIMETHYNLSFIRLSMNYFTYYEVIKEGGGPDERLALILDKLNTVISNLVNKDMSSEEILNTIKETEELRNEIIKIMKGLTSYVDIFNLYEYCLNRVEYRFVDQDKINNIKDEEMLENLINYIVSENDNMVINSKILEIVRQLPVRMTKNRFFELLKTGLMIYKDGEISAFNDFLYMLETTSTLKVSPYTSLVSEDLVSIRENFSNSDFANITKEEYDDLKSKLTYAVNYIEKNVTLYMTLEEVINDLYIILMAKDNVLEDSDCEKICKSITKKINNQMLLENEELDDITDEFIELEGLQEGYQRDLYRYQGTTEMIMSEYKDLMAEETLHSFKNIEKMDILSSGSIFVEFDDKEEGVATKKYIETKFEELYNGMKELFANNNKLFNRAVMAHVLSGLPVFFNNFEEVKDYIFSSITQCGDTAEKTAVFEIFNEMLLGE